MTFPSTLIENAVQEFSKLPGIGKKTALRLVLHLLKQEISDVQLFSDTIRKMRAEIKYCRVCNNIADAELCNICANTHRNKRQVCVVESIRDVLAIEATQQFGGTYHILGGLISPLDGVGPDKLFIESLLNRIANEQVEEIIFATNPTLEGDTTTYYITKKITNKNIKITTLARGVAFGGELEYADELTLARSFQNRLPLDSFVNHTS
jgi:DNA replication and repair protein RecR